MNILIILSLILSLTSVATRAEASLEYQRRELDVYAPRVEPAVGHVSKPRSALRQRGSQHYVVQRQAECTPDSAELDRRIAATNCDPDYLAALQAAGNNCDYFGLRFIFNFFEDLLGKCATDRNGTLCALHDPDLTKEEGDQEPDMSEIAEDIEDHCLETQSLSQTLENCSSECRRALEEFSGRFGCCIHTESTITDDDTARILAPLLWSKCDVTRPDPCRDTPVLPEPLADVTCSYQCAITQYFALQCMYVGSKQLQIYEDCNASSDDSVREIRQTCGFNDRGDYCGITSFDREYAFTVYKKCYQFYTTNDCPIECKEAIQEMRDMYGCCVNNRNSTGSNDQGNIEVLVTRYDLWSSCGVETPGLCSIPADLSVYDELTQCNTCVES